MLFIIYIGDMMGDCTSPNYQHSVITKRAQDRAPEKEETELHKRTRTTCSNLAKDSQEEWVKT